MPEVAAAFSNNDVAIVAWTFDRHLDGCLGFAIHQIDVGNNDKETVLPAMALRRPDWRGPDHRASADPEVLVESL